MTAHWGVEDPAAASGNEAQRMRAFRDAFRTLEHRIRLFAALPLESLDRPAAKRELDRIGRLRPTNDEERPG